MKPLEMICLIKPVPDPKQWSKLTLDPETMLLRRSGISAVINPLDRHAIEEAVALKETAGGRVRVATMAPPDAEDQLIEALAMGCDEAFLLTDPAFAGAGSLATARCLSAAIRKLGMPDLILCGGYSLDGSTSQVGPQVAELLGIPDLTHVVEMSLSDGLIRARCKIDEGLSTWQAELPVLVTLAAEANTPRLASMVGVRRASGRRIVRWGAADLALSPDEVGLRGSPTQMLNVFTAPMSRKGEILRGSPDEMAAALLRRLSLKRKAH